MGRYIATRILTACLTIWGVATIVFVLMHLIPGGIVEALAGPAVAQRPELVARIMEKYGLDQPLIVQYGKWLGNALRGDLGQSLGTNLPIMDEIIRKGRITIELAGAATLVSLVVGVPMGMLAALRSRSGVDGFVRITALVGLSIPDFVLGTLLIYFVSTRDIGLPVSQYISWTDDVVGHVKSMVMPTLVLAVGITAVVMRVIRASVLDVLNEPYVVTARAKGVRERMVITRHVLRAALIPTVTIVGINMGYLLSGAIIVEQLFSVPGLGRYAIQGILGRDYPVAQATVVVGTLAFVVANLVTDILYTYLDPRIKY